MPAPFDSHHVKPFFTALGFLAATQAQHEFVLDLWQRVIFTGFDCSGFETELQRVFSRKVTFLGKAYSNIDQLAAFRGNADALLSTSLALADRRNRIIHSAITKMPAGDALIELTRHVGGINRSQTAKENYSALEVDETAEELMSHIFRLVDTINSLASVVELSRSRSDDEPNQ